MEDGYAAYRQLRFGSSEEEEEEDEIEEIEELNRKNPAVGSSAVPAAKASSASSSFKQGHSSKVGDWSQEASFALLNAWAQKCEQLNRCNLKMEHWTEVARAVSQRSKSVKTDVQCKNRLDTLKKRYKQEKLKPSSSWPYLTALDTILSSLTPKQQPQQQQQYHQYQQQQQQPQQRAIASSEAVAVADSVAVELLNSRPVKTHKHKLEWSDLSEDGGEQQEQRSKKVKKNPVSSEEASCNELLRTAIRTLGEIYERIEASKQQYIMELEKKRLQFTKDMEVQRMQIMMQIQVELAKIKYGAGRNDRRS